ncbi:MAG: type II toxin-antitoxin system HicA family toxin [bacterium]|nr:type II toxin-antitoxin system HicA family toxin [bacterium]MDE0287721.1 type II toxin-antitoxin system HicA family toxin [bacterium]MDE0437208.1 type II toxin-antitoxin system HicA family toxin [bacterium]
MNTKQRRTLEKVFKKPTPADIRWNDIMALLNAVGVNVSQRSGSRVGLKKGSERMVVHRPHPEPETGRKTVRAIARFLTTTGIEP